MKPTNQLTKIQLSIFQQYPSFKDFLTDYHPAQLLVNYDEINTLQQSLSKFRMRIEDIHIIYSEGIRNASVDYVVKWLDFLNKFSNINKQLTELNSVAYMIYKDYKDFYLSDLKIIFERIMRAEYGPFYGSVDAQRILYGFSQYNQERNMLLQKEKSKFNKELEDVRDRARNDVELAVGDRMREPEYINLIGREFWEKKQQLIAQLLPEALHQATVNFYKEYEKRNNDGKN